MQYYLSLLFTVLCGTSLHSMHDITSDFLFKLINKKPEQYIVDTMGPLVISPALLNNYDDYGLTLLHRAIEKDYCKVADLLIRKGTKVNAATETFQRTPLYYAVQKGSVAMVKLLLGHGADTSAPDITRETPLHCAALDNKDEIMYILLSHGAAQRENLIGNTPLDYVLWQEAAQECFEYNWLSSLPDDGDNSLLKQMLTTLGNPKYTVLTMLLYHLAK